MATKPKTKKTSAEPAKRRLESPKYHSFKMAKKIKHPKGGLPKARTLFAASLRHLWAHRKPFVGITLIYLTLTILLVKGLNTSGEVPAIKQGFQDVLHGTTGQIATGVAVFGFLVGSASGVSSEVAGTYQSMLLINVSLALIWSLRQTHAGTKVGVREAFYRGMYPLVPFLAVLLVIGLQFIPLAVGSWLFGVTITSGLAVTGPEQFLWISLCFLLVLLTVYMVSSSVFALYVATLPDMTPMKALRSTRELVRYRRWTVLRKVLFLPLVVLVLGALVVIPVILLIAPLAEWVFFVLTMTVLAVTHSYLYSLYRELL